MKVFLSWSGKSSHKIAVTLRDWIPSVIQSITPYVSSEDIDKGARWSTDIAKELEDSAFGILCVTKENLKAPWLTFEAGALSKTMEKTYVVPFLFDVKRSEVDGPILQFQSTITTKADILKLLKTINKACDEDKLPEARLEKTFEVWYPTLKAELDSIKKDFETEEEEGKKSEDSNQTQNNEILEEILDLTRTQQKLLRDPEALLPMGYFREILERYGNMRDDRHSREVIRHPAFRELLMSIEEMSTFINEIQSQKSVSPSKVEEHFHRIYRHYDYVRHKLLRHPRNRRLFE